MKRILLIVISAFCLTYAFAQEKLNIDIQKSKLKWSCDYAFYFGGHKGTVEFKEGYFIKTKGVIVGGEFIIDMNSIVCTDNEKIDRDSGLVNHLKNQDFFDVKKYPIAKLVITNVLYEDDLYIKIVANLTIKNSTLPINFRGKVDYKKQELTTKFKIDRTLWGITYNSKEVEGALKDGLISDAIEFEVRLNL